MSDGIGSPDRPERHAFASTSQLTVTRHVDYSDARVSVGSINSHPWRIFAAEEEFDSSAVCVGTMRPETRFGCLGVGYDLINPSVSRERVVFRENAF